jgi:hypothetical protein
MLDRVLGREPGEKPIAIDASELTPQAEDVWKSLRF